MNLNKCLDCDHAAGFFIGENMSDVEKLHEKISNLPLADLCILCGNAIKSNMDQKKIDLLLHYLEIALQKERYLTNLGIK